MKTLREQIAFFLKASGTNASVLSRKAGVTKATLSKVLSSKQKDVRLCTAYAIYNAMKELDANAAEQALIQVDLPQ